MLQYKTWTCSVTISLFQFAEKFIIGQSLQFESSKELVVAYRHHILQSIVEDPGKQRDVL